MVTELQFDGVGIEIVLLFEVRLIVFSDVVFDERDRNNQGKIFLPIEFNDLEKLLFLIGRKLIFEITHHVL